MRAPAFWDLPPRQFSALRFLLAPLGWIYGHATKARPQGLSRVSLHGDLKINVWCN